MRYYFYIFPEERTERTGQWCRGEILRLEVNPKDEKVLVYRGTEPVGAVGTIAETGPVRTISAPLFKRMMEQTRVAGAVGKILSEKTVADRCKGRQTCYLAEAFFLPNRSEAGETESRCYEVGGPVAAYPAMLGLLDRLQRKTEEAEPIGLFVEENTENGILQCRDPETGELCGRLEQADEELRNLVTEGKRAEAEVVSAVLKENRFEISVSGIRPAKASFYPDIDETVARGVAQAPELEEKVAFMLENRVPDTVVRAVLRQMPRDPDPGVPVPGQRYGQKSGSNLADALGYLVLGKLLRLVGEKGSGKNTLAETCAWLLNRPLCRIQGSSELDKLDLLGSLVLKNGETVFEPSEMMETLLKGGIVVIDEANIVRPDVLALMHSLTDSARSISLPMAGFQKIDPHAGIIYTLNEDYTGTGEMNAATIDRGPSLIIRQESDLYELLKRVVPGAGEESIRLCVAVSDAIRKAVQESGMLSRDSITVRGYIDALESAAYIPLGRALVQNVANKAQSESERTAIEGIISSFCDLS